MALVTLLVPLVIEILRLILSTKTSEAAKRAGAEALLKRIKEINAAVKKVEETGGDTSDLEKIINRPR